MDSKITSTNRRPSAHQGGFVLSEMLVVMGISAILMLALTVFFMLGGRSFAAMFNYVDLDDANRIAMDLLSRDIRQSNRVTGYATNRLTLEDSDLTPIVYDWDRTNRTLTRIRGAESKVLLKECDTLRFDIAQRTPVKGTYEFYPSATVTNAKVIDVSWVCSRQIFGRKENTESVQTARIVIRKQGT